MNLERVCFYCGGPAPDPVRVALAGVGSIYVCDHACARRARTHHGHGRRLERPPGAPREASPELAIVVYRMEDP